MKLKSLDSRPRFPKDRLFAGMTEFIQRDLDAIATSGMRVGVASLAQ